jgi:hypothetical protein
LIQVLVGTVSSIDKSVAELIKGSVNGVQLRLTVLVPVSLLVVGVYTLHLHVKLGKILWLSVSHGPLVVVVSWVELLLLWLSVVAVVVLVSSSIIIVVIPVSLFLLLWFLLRLEDLVLDFLFFDVLLLVVVLEPDDGNHVTDVLFALEKLVHESGLESVLDVAEFA